MTDSDLQTVDSTLVETHASALIRNYEVGKAAHSSDPHLRSAVHIDPVAINAKIERFVPKIRTFIDTFGPVMPPAVPAIANAVLALYVAIDQNLLSQATPTPR